MAKRLSKKNPNELISLDAESLRNKIEAPIAQSKHRCGVSIELWVDTYLSNGLDGVGAYLEVFKTPIDSKGLWYFRNTKEVREMIALKTKELSLNSLITKLDLLDEINEVKAMCKDKPNALNIANLLKAIEMQSKMLGYNEPEKIDIRMQQVVQIDFGLEPTIEDIDLDDEDNS